jgi:heme/copper-type cytochrome/quinol oxidase subunit 2
MSGIHPQRALQLALCLFLLVPPALGEDPVTLEVTIQGHRFAPAEVHVQAGKPIFLVVTNQDRTPEEFEVRHLGVERVIPGGTRARIRIRPLRPGRYEFMGEFHPDLAQGAILSE